MVNELADPITSGLPLPAVGAAWHDDVSQPADAVVSAGVLG